MSSPHVLLLGGHGKVSLHLTPLLVARNWRLTSVIRNADHKADILAAAGSKGEGKVDVLVESLEDVKSEGDARKILERVRPDYVVWSAGMFLQLNSPRGFASCLYSPSRAGKGFRRMDFWIPSSSLKLSLSISRTLQLTHPPP